MFSIRGWQVGPVRRFVLQSADKLKLFSVSQHNPNTGLPILSDSNILLTSPLRLSSIQTRKFHTTENREFNWAQNPIKSLQIHLLLMRLKSEWDPSFSKEDFIYGAENAAVNISWLLQDNDWKELRGLLTRKEFKRLQTEVRSLNLRIVTLSSGLSLRWRLSGVMSRDRMSDFNLITSRVPSLLPLEPRLLSRKGRLSYYNYKSSIKLSYLDIVI